MNKTIILRVTENEYSRIQASLLYLQDRFQSLANQKHGNEEAYKRYVDRSMMNTHIKGSLFRQALSQGINSTPDHNLGINDADLTDHADLDKIGEKMALLAKLAELDIEILRKMAESIDQS